MADELRTHNRREKDAELEAELRAIRDQFKVTTAMRRGIFLIGARNGMWLTRVPGEFWAQSDSDTRVIACVCGLSPEVKGWLEVTKCECGRAFVFDGDDVRVDRPPAVRYPAPTPPE